jgi:hypothetical protein
VVSVPTTVLTVSVCHGSEDLSRNKDSRVLMSLNGGSRDFIVSIFSIEARRPSKLVRNADGIFKSDLVYS